MLHALVVFATEAAGEEETSKAAFYVLGLLLAGWAVAISVVGIRRAHDFPPRPPMRTGVILVSAVLVAGTMSSAVLTA
jgi:hypothetical protein